MSVINVKEILEPQEASFDDKVTREYVRAFVVECNSITDGPQTAALGTGIPGIYNSYVNSDGTSFDFTSYCRKINVSSLGPFVWRVVCNYSSKQDWPQDQQNQNPLLRPADIDWDGQTYEKPLVADENGARPINSANEAFDPPLTVEDTRPILLYSRNEASYDPGRAIQYQDVVNSDIFYGADPGYAKMKKIKGTRQFENGIIFWKVTYEIHFRYDSFTRLVLDQGFRDINGKLFRDPVDGQPYAAPTLMNGLGANLKTATTTLAGNLASDDLLVAVAAMDKFPDPDNWQYSIIIDQEEMLVVTQSGPTGAGTFEVERGYNSTLVADHTATAVVSCGPVYKILEPFRSVAFAPLNLL